MKPVGSQHKSCDIDSHGLVCKSQGLADQAIMTAWEAGTLDRHKLWIDKLIERGVDCTLINEIAQEMDNDI